jgi:hypothetical protein
LRWPSQCSRRLQTTYPDFQDRADYSNPNTLVYLFNAEAKRLWEIQVRRPPLLTTVQAAIILQMLFNLCGQDELGQEYGEKAVELAQELRMFDAPDGALNKHTRNARTFTAWALYNWTT